jgi:diguanylate cyclase (GGDEF)-like protein
MERPESITESKQDESQLRRAYHALEIAHRELQESFAREQHLARIDELTGVNNRRSLVEFMEQEFKVAMRYRVPLSVVMFDIDDFKQINDTFGHSVGDQVLQCLTQVVRAKLRSADVIGRYGGDEFVILCPHTSAQEALPIAERIHTSSASIRMETDKGPLTITISIGIAQTTHSSVPGPGKSDTLENLLRRADQALYEAKQTGKNRTVIFDSK